VILGVTGGKGGPGATVLAANLAIAMARMGKQCLLVDLDPTGGDIGAYLGPERLDPKRGLLPLLKLERSAIACEAVKRESQEVAPGLTVLLGSLRPAADLLAGRTADVLRSADRTTDVVVADLGRSVPSSPMLDGLSEVDGLFLAARPDLQGALAAERALSLIGNEASVQVVAIKVRRRRAADVAELSEALGRPIVASVPELRTLVSLNQSRRLRRELARVIADLDEIEPAAERRPGGLQEVAAS
jgi:MinD-like ATPase involved in chromosome partitioning or flagellar assembly